MSISISAQCRYQWMGCRINRLTSEEAKGQDDEGKISTCQNKPTFCTIQWHLTPQSSKTISRIICMLVRSSLKAILSHVPNLDYASVSHTAGHQGLWWLQRQEEWKTLTSTTFLATENKSSCLSCLWMIFFTRFHFFLIIPFRNVFFKIISSSLLGEVKWRRYLKCLYTLIIHFWLIWTTHDACVSFSILVKM